MKEARTKKIVNFTDWNFSRKSQTCASWLAVATVQSAGSSRFWIRSVFIQRQQSEFSLWALEMT